jgi:hypothetical protein
MIPKYPIFIPTKGRYDKPLTIRAFDEIGVPYKIVIEQQEYDEYSRIVDEDRIIILPHQDKGLVVTRNWIWDFAQSLDTPFFWTFDDNTRKFWRWNRNRKLKVKSGAIFRAIEDWVERYENVAIAGLEYFMFVRQKYPDVPIRFNTRVYSNMLIRTDIPYRNRGFYNDDTDLCLQVLNDGWCTALFMAFLIEKSVTMTVKGGMTPHYQGDGRLKMALELQRRWPQYVKVTRKWGRWQHQVDYRPFKKNKLIMRDDIEIPEGVNNYGMKLVRVE